MATVERNTSGIMRFTLIVAVTPSLGIGRNGALPWPRIKSEMAYFARITKRSPDLDSSSMNAVIMGRKTWESIPPKFRPLPDRLNVVVTRHPEELRFPAPNGSATTPLAASSLQDAMKLLKGTQESKVVDRIFIIGGGQIYAEAARAAEAERILLTRISQEYDCDTFFPLQLGSDVGDATKWKLCANQARDEWLGEQQPGGDEWTVQMWERSSSIH